VKLPPNKPGAVAKSRVTREPKGSTRTLAAIAEYDNIVIEGISRTGVIVIRPYKMRIGFGDPWEKFFDEWKAKGKMQLAKSGNQGYGHIQLVSPTMAQTTHERGERLCAFMLLGSTEGKHLQKVLEAKAHPNLGFKFRRVDHRASPMDDVNFIYQSEQGSEAEACEMFSGEIVKGELVIDTAITKSYL
jgi:hypothetical protein